MPYGVSKGFFGTLTRAAVIKYQKSVGLPSDGIFDSVTRAKLIPEPAQIAVKPTLPSTALETFVPPSFFQTIFKYVKSLYVNPLEGVITLLLLAAIIFMIFKIKKQ
jgi:peptidoglycan hydrolase-like protein with peptidoglycan-binding domain